MRDDPIPLHVCPGCGARNNRAADVFGHGDPRRAGDFDVCSRCGMVGEVNAEGTTRPLTPAEVDALDAAVRDEIRRAQRAVVLAHGRN